MLKTIDFDVDELTQKLIAIIDRFATDEEALRFIDRYFRDLSFFSAITELDNETLLYSNLSENDLRENLQNSFLYMPMRNDKDVMQTLWRSWQYVEILFCDDNLSDVQKKNSIKDFISQIIDYLSITSDWLSNNYVVDVV